MVNVSDRYRHSPSPMTPPLFSTPPPRSPSPQDVEEAMMRRAIRESLETQTTVDSEDTTG